MNSRALRTGGEMSSSSEDVSTDRPASGKELESTGEWKQQRKRKDAGRRRMSEGRPERQVLIVDESL